MTINEADLARALKRLAVWLNASGGRSVEIRVRSGGEPPDGVLFRVYLNRDRPKGNGPPFVHLWTQIDYDHLEIALNETLDAVGVVRLPSGQENEKGSGS